MGCRSYQLRKRRDAYTAALMTKLGFKALYGSGWQLAATWNMFPDIGVYNSHQMAELTDMLRKGIEGARHTHWYDTGKELLDAAGFGHGSGFVTPDVHACQNHPVGPAVHLRTRLSDRPAATSSMWQGSEQGAGAQGGSPS
jgi:hypothetical protein